MKKNLLCFSLGICLGLAAYHVFAKKEKKQDILMKVGASPWISYDIGEMESQQRYIDELLNGLEDGTKIHKSGN